jgi:hypothetical protein
VLLVSLEVGRASGRTICTHIVFTDFYFLCVVYVFSSFPADLVAAGPTGLSRIANESPRGDIRSHNSSTFLSVALTLGSDSSVLT